MNEVFMAYGRSRKLQKIMKMSVMSWNWKPEEGRLWTNCFSCEVCVGFVPRRFLLSQVWRYMQISDLFFFTLSLFVLFPSKNRCRPFIIFLLRGLWGVPLYLHWYQCLLFHASFLWLSINVRRLACYGFRISDAVQKSPSWRYPCSLFMLLSWWYFVSADDHRFLWVLWQIANLFCRCAVSSASI